MSTCGRAHGRARARRSCQRSKRLRGHVQHEHDVRGEKVRIEYNEVWDVCSSDFELGGAALCPERFTCLPSRGGGPRTGEHSGGTAEVMERSLTASNECGGGHGTLLDLSQTSDKHSPDIGLLFIVTKENLLAAPRSNHDIPERAV
jgi:hypothetical protein